MLRHSFSIAAENFVATQFSMSRHSFLLCDKKICPTYRGHNFFVLTRILACEVSLESSFNVECNHEYI